MARCVNEAVAPDDRVDHALEMESSPLLGLSGIVVMCGERFRGRYEKSLVIWDLSFVR